MKLIVQEAPAFAAKKSGPRHTVKGAPVTRAKARPRNLWKS